MLNRSQLITLFGLSRRNKNPHHRFIKDIRQLIVKISSAAFDPQSDIATLLHYIAYGNLSAAKDMLDANPRLVLQAGHTVTPSGLKVLHTTPLECALGAGDPEMAKMIAPYFNANEIAGGATVRDEQYARYRQYIEDMLNPKKNPPYDFTLLIKTLMMARPVDVTAALYRNINHDSLLRDVLEHFRKDFTPGSITSGMHFNYQHLRRAFEVYDQNYEKLYKNAGNYTKLALFSRQIIGFIQRSLPAIDRMVFAQSLYDVIENMAEIKRSFKFTTGTTFFPDTAEGHSSLSGLGFEYFVAGGATLACAGHDCRWRWFGNLMSHKHYQLAELMQAEREEKTSRCVIC